MHKNEDLKLIEQFKKTHQGVLFAEIVKRYEKRVYGLAYRILFSREDALDITQEVFIKVYRNIYSFRAGGSFYTWLYRITYNLCIDFLRSRKNTGNIEDYCLIDEKPSPLKQAEANEIRNKIEGALKFVPLRQRTVFILRQDQGLANKQIAEILSISEGSVKANYFWAIQKLKGILNGMQ